MTNAKRTTALRIAARLRTLPTKRLVAAIVKMHTMQLHHVCMVDAGFALYVARKPAWQQHINTMQ